MRYWTALVIAAGLIVVAACPAFGSGTLDQSQGATPPDNAFAPRNVTYVAQTYTAGQTGTLDQVDLLLSRLEPLERNLTVQIQTTLSGRPTGVVLDSAQLTPAQVPVSQFPDLSFVSVPLPGSQSVAGTQYAIVVSDPTAEPFGGAQYLWGQSHGDPYAAGTALLTFDAGAFWHDVGGDMGFKTYVSSAPALPVAKDDCKDGGWQSFPQFTSQGDCVSFLVHAP
jgi:hypothetical protein